MPTTIMRYTDAEVADIYREEYNALPHGSASRTAERIGVSPQSIASRLSKMRRAGFDLPAPRGRKRGQFCPTCGASAWAAKPERVAKSNDAAPSSVVSSASMLSDD